MSVEMTQLKLETLGLDQAAVVLGHRSEQAAKSDWSHLEFLNSILDEEIAARNERSLRARTRLARIPTSKTLENFDFEAQPGVDRQLIHDLATLSFIDRTDNVCFLGPPGVASPIWR